MVIFLLVVSIIFIGLLWLIIAEPNNNKERRRVEHRKKVSSDIAVEKLEENKIRVTKEQM